MGEKSLAQMPAHRNGPVSSNVRPRTNNFAVVIERKPMDITAVAGAALEATKIVVNPSGYLIAQLTEVMSKKVAKSATESPAELPSLRVQAERQELEMRIAEAQAKVA